MGRNIGPNQNIRRTDEWVTSSRSLDGGRRSASGKINLIFQWLPLSFLYQNPCLLFRSKPLLLLLQLTISFSVLTNLKPVMFWSFSCFIRWWFLSSGSRRGCLRIKAISTKWEPTKVLPFPFNFILYLICFEFGHLSSDQFQVVPQADRVLVRLEELPQVYLLASLWSENVMITKKQELQIEIKRKKNSCWLARFIVIQLPNLWSFCSCDSATDILRWSVVA